MKKEIISKLYETYGFITQDMSKFKNIAFSDIPKNADENKLEEYCKKNIVEYLVNELKNGKFTILFKNAMNVMSEEKVFALFDTVINIADIDIIPDAILGIAMNKKYQPFFDKCLNTKEKYESTLLGDVLEAYNGLNEDEDLEIAVNELTNNLSDDQLRDYLVLISGFSVLTREEEQYLIRKYKETNDDYYRDEFINHNLRLAAKIALKFWKPELKISKMDLIQEGNMGLLNAFRKFDSTEGSKFSTYASWWIKQKVTRAIADQNDTIRIPVHRNDNIIKKNKFINEYMSIYGNEPTDEEVMEHLGVGIEELKSIKEAEIIKNPSSLDQVVDNQESKAGRESTMSQFLKDEDAENADDMAMNGLLREQLLGYLYEVLNERERLVIRARFGINEDGTKYTLEQIGKALGLTRERVRQIESKALNKLSKKGYAIKRAEENLQISTGRELEDPIIMNTRREFESKLREKNNNLRVESYTPDNKKVTVKCLECGKLYTGSMDNVLEIDECLYCYAQKLAKNEKRNNALDKFNAKLMKKTSGKMIALSLETNGAGAIVRCLECGNQWEKNRYNLLNKPNCPRCSTLSRLGKMQLGLQTKLDELNGKIKVMDYLGSKEKSKFKCLECGTEWEELSYNLLRKPYCPNCIKKQLVKKK